MSRDKKMPRGTNQKNVSNYQADKTTTKIDVFSAIKPKKGTAKARSEIN